MNIVSLIYHFREGQNLYFIMDNIEIIHQFFCYGTDENHPVIDLICERLKVDWINRKDYEKLTLYFFNFCLFLLHLG